MTVTPTAPTVSAAFSPDTVAANVPTVLVVIFNNANAFTLTQSGITVALPVDVTLSSQTPSSTCGGAALSLTSASTSVTLSGANIPAGGSCNISFGVVSALEGVYPVSIPANALVTGPAGSNAAPASATLNVTAATGSLTPAASGGGGGGLDWLDILLVAGILLIVRGHAAKR